MFGNIRRPSSVPPPAASQQSPRKSLLPSSQNMPQAFGALPASRDLQSANSPQSPSSASAPGGYTFNPLEAVSPSSSLKDLTLGSDEDKEFDSLLVEYEKEKEKLAILPEKWEPRVVEKSGLEAEIEADVCKDILTVPKDDVEIRKIKREFRTENMPALEAEVEVPRPIRDLYNFFTSDWVEVQKKTFRAVQEKSCPPPPDYMQLHADQYELDQMDSARRMSSDVLEQAEGVSAGVEITKPINRDILSDQEADPPLIDFLHFKLGETNKFAAAIRAENRIRLLRMSSAVERECEDPGSVLSQENPFGRIEPRRIKVEFSQCRLSTVLNEPFFGSAFLYNTRTKERLSEVYHVDIREPDAHSLAFDTAAPSWDPESHTCTAIFNIAHATVDLHLVLMIDKVTEGDPSEYLERFVAKAKLSHPDKVKSTLNRLQKYRQPVAYTCISLMDEQLVLSADWQAPKSVQDVKIDTLYKCEGDLPLESQIDNLLPAGSTRRAASGPVKKGKPISGMVQFKVTELDPLDIIVNRVTPSLEPLKPFLPDTLERQDRAYKLIKEVQEFTDHPRPIPHTELVNNLYVYPLSLNFSKGLSNMRNLSCKVQLLDTDVAIGVTAKPLQVFYDHDIGLQDHLYTCMAYHNRTPSFRDEIKLKLPLKLTSSHHLLFTFVHISCKGSDASKKAKKDVETEVAYAFVRLFPGGRINFTEQTELPITSSLLPGYLEETTQGKLKWIDNRKPLFSAKIRLLSTIYTETVQISDFMNVIARADGAEISDINVIAQLSTASPVALSNFAPVLLDQLFEIVFTSDEELTRRTAFKTVAAIVSVIHIDGHKQCLSLENYVNFRFDNRISWKRKPYTELLNQLLVYVKDQNSSNRDLFKYAWFYTRLIAKSVILWLDSENKLDSRMVRKETYLDQNFIGDLQTLIEELASEVLRRSKTGLVIARELCESLAYFFLDAFIFLDKSTVLRYILLFTKTISKDSTETLLDLKFDFLSIVCKYEHFVAVNLPLRSALDGNLADTLTSSQDFSDNHFIIGLLLFEIQQCLLHKSEEIRLKGLRSLRRVLETHESDFRFDRKSLARVCNMYIPFLALFCDNIARTLVCSAVVIQQPRFSTSERTQIAYCTLFIFKNMEQSTLLKWIETQHYVTYSTLLKLIEHSLYMTEYQGSAVITGRKGANANKGRETESTKRYLENMYRGGMGQTLRERRNISRTQTLPSTDKATTLKNRFNPRDRTNTLGSRVEPTVLDGVQLVRYEGCIGAEAALITLDLFDLLLNFLRQTYERDDRQNPRKLQRLFSLLSVLLTLQESERVLIATFTCVKSFVHQFSTVVFREKQNAFCSDLCRLVLKYTGSSMTSTRQHATATLYLLMRRNFEETRTNFGKSRVSTTVALSKLEPTDDTYLRKAFSTIKRFTVKDRTEAAFRTKVLDLADQLFGIVRDSVKMQAHKDDPEMLQDMTCRIAHGYKTAPDLRLATLENLARQHQQENQNAEAAMCLLHSAALVAEYLFFKEAAYGGPRGSQAFSRCTSNCQEETIWTADVGLEEEGVCQSEAFTKLGLIKLLEAALPLLTKAQLHETTNELYKLLIPIYEEQKSYLRLARAHAQLSTAFNEIWSSIQSGKRILGTYFRIGFYGTKFEALDGKEFIYKERTITQLSEICQRLSGIFAKKFSGDFQLLQDSNRIDRGKLDTNKAYIQVTFVEPYFSADELLVRTTYFEKMNHIHRFCFMTPFTKGGKTHGDVASQWMRKIVLSTEKPFPYIKKRLLVVNREEIEMSPLEVSLEAIEGRCSKLRLAIEAQQPEPKQIQMLLQGSVRLQVNAGPLEIANIFLSPANSYQHDAKPIEALRKAFKEFVRLCGVGLALNRSLIKEDQVNYQNDLEEGFEDMKRKLGVYLPDLQGTANRKATGLDSVLSFITSPVSRDQVTVDVARFLAS